jgi:hypothetical protein
LRGRDAWRDGVHAPVEALEETHYALVVPEDAEVGTARVVEDLQGYPSPIPTESLAYDGRQSMERQVQIDRFRCHDLHRPQQALALNPVGAVNVITGLQ